MRRGVRFALSAVSGVLVLVLVSWYGSSIRAEAERERQDLLASYGGDVVSVCVASHDIAAGEMLDEGDVRMEDWVAGLLPADAATSIEDVVGKRVSSSVPERAVLCPVYFQERTGGLEVPEGAVAVSVAVDPAHAVGGSVASGDAVDVYLSGAGLADRICRATVIDTSAEQAGGASGDLSWVTLAVEPDRVSELLAAVAQGTVSLVAPGSGVDESLGTGSNDSSESLGTGSNDSSAAEDVKDSEGAADPEDAGEASDAEADAQDTSSELGGDAR
ncbi:Flp pilus assembly protein CpaB [[Collinsella] massiliensis]|uniref:Flp pilus assembly protein CpaB n=1 Tax=[Collinsella] massiliensis TaxID=1232426 RepID=A0A1Y3XRP5_9ACTN|nr:Flp pilus assembly protein CpaB [[Collinsella] massiliensis]